MKAFCMDVHISVIADFKSACREIEVTDWCLSGHAWVMNRRQDVPNHINAHTWQNITTDMIARFQNEYDTFLKTFDFFIVGYSSCFAMIYEKYNKPVLMLNAVRYDVPFCWNKNLQMREAYKQCLTRMHSADRLILISNNRPDHMYTLKSLGINSQIIPSLCLYAGIRYDPRKPEFLLYNNWDHRHPLLAKRPPTFDWKDIGSYRGIVHMPYEATPTMSMFEQFTGGMPLFLPSISFWKTTSNIQNVSSYWGEHTPVDLEEFQSSEYWLSISDLYDALASPNTHIFDSAEHLNSMLESFVYVPEDKTTYIENTKNLWKKVMFNLERGS